MSGAAASDGNPHLSHRGTIFLSEAEILEHESHPGDQYVLRVRAPDAARTAQPGSFAHVRCDASVPLRRPLSIMRADSAAGWLEFLYKPVGKGLAKLARKRVGERVSLLAPIGTAFTLDPRKPRLVAIGGGVGIPPMIFQALKLPADFSSNAVVLMGSEVPFPFELTRSRLGLGALPEAATHGLKILEERGICSRLASRAGLAGAYPGLAPELALRVLESRTAEERHETQLIACGPEPMLRATARLAAELELTCQIAVEEFMACGVGGCAGCTVLVDTGRGRAMKRVCVDGPVFDARDVYP